MCFLRIPKDPQLEVWLGQVFSVLGMNYISLVKRCRSKGPHPLVFLLYYLLTGATKVLFIKSQEQFFCDVSSKD